MPKVNLSGMNVEVLMDLRQQIDDALHIRSGRVPLSVPPSESKSTQKWMSS
jgi:hypothetical protein